MNQTRYTKVIILSVIGISILSLSTAIIMFPDKLQTVLGGAIGLHLDNIHSALFDNFGMLAYEFPFLMIFGYVSWKYAPKNPSPIRKLCAVWIINSWFTTTIIYLFSSQFQFVYRFVPLAVFMSIFIAITINDLGKWYIESKMKEETKRECDFCGTKKGVKVFSPTDEEPNYHPAFCYKCFMSDECTSDEPMTQEEKQKEWDESKTKRTGWI